MADSLKAAIVGLRNHAGTLESDRGHGLIKSFKAQPDVTVVAYCEWDREQADAMEALRRADPQAQFYGGVRDLLAQETFDLAVILLPPGEAISAALELVAAGKHLYIEKNGARRVSELGVLEWGSVLTKPIEVTGASLHLNTDSWRGTVLVEVIDAATGQPIPGYTRDASRPAVINSIDASVRWQSKADLADLLGKTVRLRFHLWQAELYAFWFGEGAQR